MPMLSIPLNKKITAIVTLDESTARQVDTYAAYTKGSPDDVVNEALNYIFAKDKDFQKYRDENATAKPTITLRIKRPTNTTAKPQQHAKSNSNGNGAAR